MSDLEANDLTPRALAKLTVPTPDLQRNYRTRGMMGGIGQLNEAGQWRYGPADLVAVWISDRLSSGAQGMDRRDSLRLGSWAAHVVIRAFLAFEAGRSPLGPYGNRYAVIFHDGAKPKNGRTAKHVASLDEVGEVDFDWVQIVDLHRLARTIPPEIQAHLIAANEKSLEGATPDYAALMAEIEAGGG